MKSAAFHGLLVVDKPLGCTSREVVNRALRWFPRGTSIGHAGTLDPLATGVLVLCIGRATRLMEYVQRMPKAYETCVRLGARSATDDAEGPVTEVSIDRPPELAEVDAALRTFVGEIDQVPPAFSAAHVAGRRAYSLARQGETVALSARPVVIHRISADKYEYPSLDLTVECGKGTYIRSLARDLGEKLGCGGMVETLRRTRIGSFIAAEAIPIDANLSTARQRLLSPAAALSELMRVDLQADEARRLRAGQMVPVKGVAFNGQATEVAVFTEEELVGVAVLHYGGHLKASKIFPADMWPPREDN
jgi:tRNA pseudouridine55 synthase